jgi:hypothetical protein
MAAAVEGRMEDIGTFFVEADGRAVGECVLRGAIAPPIQVRTGVAGG